MAVTPHSSPPPPRCPGLPSLYTQRAEQLVTVPRHTRGHLNTAAEKRRGQGRALGSRAPQLLSRASEQTWACRGAGRPGSENAAAGK